METVNKIQKVEKCGHVSKCMSSPESYRSGISSWGTPSDAAVAALALRKLEEAKALDDAIHEKNSEALAINNEIAKQYREYVTAIGIPKEYKERDTKSRARYPKWIDHYSGWVHDISRFIITDDGYDSQMRTYNDLKQRYERFRDEAEKKAAIEAGAAEREKEALKKRREEDMKLVAIISRYGLDILSTWEDVLYEMLKKDRLLNLAVAMEMTRGDWSEGCYRVRDALFVPSNEQEEAVIRDVTSLCEDFDDGRVFRDCTWNYNSIYAIIEDRQLVADVQEAMSHNR